MSVVRMGARTIEVSNLDKVIFPEEGITKGDLIEYYRRIAGRMIPYLRDRPLTMRRYPDGIRSGGFVQQNAPDYFPSWIDTATVTKEGGSVTHVLCNNAWTLVYLANQGVVTPHVWLSRTDRPRRPDRMIFDLDPPGTGSDGGFVAVRRAAKAVRALMQQLGLPTFVMTTGSSGLHVVSPLARSEDFEVVRTFAHGAANVLASRHANHLTVEQRKEKRDGRVFIDTLRNAYGQTAVPPFAVRARPRAPVAAPLEWGELDNADLHSQRYSITNLFRRLGQKDDPWTGMARRRHSLAEASRRLEEIWS